MVDLIIIGGGPAGLTAGLYATRGGLKDVIMFEKGMPGGAITQSSEVENYPGYCEPVTGMELMECWPKQAMRFGLRHEMKEVSRVVRECDGTFTIQLADGSQERGKAVIVATGTTPKKAGFEGEEEFFGRGVSTCATCDGFFYKDQEVAVLGGGDTALEEALYLAKIASKVYLIHRRESFRAAPSTVERVKKNPKIELILNATVKRAYGDEMGLQGVIIEQEGREIDLKVPGLFVFVGSIVNTQVLKQEDGGYLCELNERGEIVVDLKMRTSVPGLYGCGDVRADSARQVVCAAGDGATAAVDVIHYIEKIGELKPC
ncbi:MAG: thioredoxin-disulfide reductase [Epsilonproteobacteria bacterium]|nr:thioredoxin-disulfide reductase [Campylobacterota bacterium]NPA56790.1 thioredoxin-disulfide reductase [Campylobacterota bacterium]